MSIEAFISNFGYVAVFVLVFVVCVVPAFMPPAWLILATVYFLVPTNFNPILLAFVGASATILGRFILSYLGFESRRAMSDERRRSMDKVGQALKSKRYGGFLTSLLFALTPLPSNIYFLIMGMIKAQYFSIFFGFWLGRFINNWIMIIITPVAFQSLAEVLTGRLQAVIVVDLLGTIAMVVFAFIDWERLILERRVVFIKPKLFNRLNRRAKKD